MLELQLAEVKADRDTLQSKMETMNLDKQRITAVTAKEVTSARDTLATVESHNENLRKELIAANDHADGLLQQIKILTVARDDADAKIVSSELSFADKDAQLSQVIVGMVFCFCSLCNICFKLGA